MLDAVILQVLHEDFVILIPQRQLVSLPAKLFWFLKCTLCAKSQYFEGFSNWVLVITSTIQTVHDHCLSLNTKWPLFCLIKHSFTPTAWNCVTKQRSPLACVAARTMCTSSVTSNNGTIFIQQPVYETVCARRFHMTLSTRKTDIEGHSLSMAPFQMLECPEKLGSYTFSGT